MTIAYTPKDAVLDVIAVALILAPEPVTTPIGISILCRKRGGAQLHEPKHPLHLYPDYVYRVDNIRGREITWEARTVLPGQLPLMEINKPEIKFKDREEYILSRTKAEKSTAQRIAESLPPGVKVHHEIFRPPRFPDTRQPAFIPGETIHHTVREWPKALPLNNRAQGEANIHHTIETSPGYILAKNAAANPAAGPSIIHHTIQGSPGVQHGNPANIVRPVRIVEHHQINQAPPIMYRGRLIQQQQPDPGLHKGANIPRGNGQPGPGRP
jgi:hypothetical protein